MNDDSLSLRSNSDRLIVDQSSGLRAQPTLMADWLVIAWRKVLLATLLLEIPLQLDTYLLHDLNDAQHGAISGFNISLTTICLVLLYLQWIPRLIVESSPFKFSKSLTVYLAIVALSALWAADKSRVVFEFFLLFQGLLIFTYLINHVKSTGDVLFVMKFLVIGLLIQASMMLFTRVYDNDIMLGPLQFQIYSVSKRVVGAFGSPNVASSFIAILMVPCLSLFFLPVSCRQKFSVFLAIMLGGIALILTMSRGGWLAAAISVAIFCTIAFQQRWLSGKIFALLLISAIPILAILSQMILVRLLGDDGGSAASRLPLVELSQSMIAAHPFGVGSNNWDVVATGLAEQGKFREEWFFLVHNKFFLVLAEIGWLGLLAFISFLVAVLACGWRALRENRISVLTPALLGFVAAFFGQTVHMWFDVFNSRAQIQMMCLVAAMIVSIAAIIRNDSAANHRKPNSEPPPEPVAP